MRSKGVDRNFWDGQSLGLPWLFRVETLRNFSAVKNLWHSHSETELHFFLKGEARYEFKDSTARAVSGTIMVIPNDVRHRPIGNIDEPGEKMGFKIRNRVKDAGMSPFSAAEFAHIRKILLRRALKPMRCPKNVMQQARLLAARIGSGDAPADAIDLVQVRIEISSLLCAAAEAVGSANGMPPVDAPLIPESKSFIESHFAEAGFSIRKLVDHIGYGHSQFFSIFKHATGMTPNAYLLRCRIKKSKELLLGGHMSVAAVSAKCGFSSPAYFRYAFKRFTGVSPVSYRCR